MGELDGKQGRQVILGSIMIDNDGQEMFDKDTAREAAEARLCSYTCPMLACIGIEVEAVTWERVQQAMATDTTVTAEPPVYPFQQVCSDYFELDGATYLVIVDRYSAIG